MVLNLMAQNQTKKGELMPAAVLILGLVGAIFTVAFYKGV